MRFSIGYLEETTLHWVVLVSSHGLQHVHRHFIPLSVLYFVLHITHTIFFCLSVEVVKTEPIQPKWQTALLRCWSVSEKEGANKVSFFVIVKLLDGTSV